MERNHKTIHLRDIWVEHKTNLLRLECEIANPFAVGIPLFLIPFPVEASVSLLLAKVTFCDLSILEFYNMWLFAVYLTGGVPSDAFSY